jgi:hypothetical protein
MPRAEELVANTACPICGHVGLPTGDSIDEPVLLPEPTPPPAPAATPNPSVAGRVLAAGVLGFVVGTAAGVAGLLGWQAAVGSRQQTAGADNAAAVNVPVPVADSGGSRPPLASTNEPIPAPREPVARAAPPADPPAPVPTPVVNPPKEQPIAFGPPARPNPDPANPFRPAAPPAEKLDNPAGVASPVVRPGSSLVLRGKVRTLRVAGLESGAVLDASDLEAEEVIVVGKIDGGSKLWLKAPNGRVTFRARVDGRSRVGIEAPGGSVAFVPEGASDGAKIDGGAQVEITAKSVRLDGTIGGAGTRVAVSVTAGGSLAFREIVGSSRLEYGTADPDDPEPSVTRGKVAAPAVVKKVTWD